MGALLILMVRWIIAGIFLRAGVVKLGDRAGFRAAVANYQLLPPTLVAPVAAVLPIAEIAGAVLLAAGILTALLQPGDGRQLQLEYSVLPNDTHAADPPVQLWLPI